MLDYPRRTGPFPRLPAAGSRVGQRIPGNNTTCRASSASYARADPGRPTVLTVSGDGLPIGRGYPLAAWQGPSCSIAPCPRPETGCEEGGDLASVPLLQPFAPPSHSQSGVTSLTSQDPASVIDSPAPGRTCGPGKRNFTRFMTRLRREHRVQPLLPFVFGGPETSRRPTLAVRGGLQAMPAWAAGTGTRAGGSDPLWFHKPVA